MSKVKIHKVTEFSYPCPEFPQVHIEVMPDRDFTPWNGEYHYMLSTYIMESTRMVKLTTGYTDVNLIYSILIKDLFKNLEKHIKTV